MKTDGDSLSRTYEYWDGELKLTDTFTLETDILTYPALEGLAAFDEPWAGTAEVDAISSARSKFDTLKANAGRDDLIFFVNLLPEHSSDDKFVSDSNTGGKYGYSLKTDYLDNYVNLVHSAGSITEYVSWDDYSLIRDTSTGTKVGIRPDYFHGFEEMVSLGKPAWYTMLSAGHTLNGTNVYYTEPTTQELRWQMAVAMSFGVSDINHYTYTSHETAYNYTTMFDYKNTTGCGGGSKKL